MNMNQIINMIIRQVMRRVVNTGINAGMNAATGAVSNRGRKGRKQQPMVEDDNYVDEIERRRKMRR